MNSTDSKTAFDQRHRDKRLGELIKEEYKYLTAQLISNEEMGEKRVSLFLTLTAGLGAAAVLAREKSGAHAAGDFDRLFLAVTAAWLLFGYLSFLRILHRNNITDELKQQLCELRKWFVHREDEQGRKLLPYDPHNERIKLHSELRIFRGNGGYAELVALINLLVAFAFGREMTIVVGSTHNRVSQWGELGANIGGVFIALLSWFGLAHVAKQRYDEAQKERKGEVEGN